MSPLSRAAITANSRRAQRLSLRPAYAEWSSVLLIRTRLCPAKDLRYSGRMAYRTESGILEEDCLKLNEVFFWYIQTGLPFVVLKYAMTMDGKIAAYTGKSQWITGEAARRRVHEDRNRYSAIMTGIGTVLADDPMLTCRIENGKNPVRIICDSRLQIPEKSRDRADFRGSSDDHCHMLYG